MRLYIISGIVVHSEFVVTSVHILDDKLAPSDGATADCGDGTTIQFVAESSPCVRQDERNQAQQEDNGRAGGSRLPYSTSRAISRK